MCVQEKVILALYGLSCTGKSTIAKQLARELGWPLRSASDAVRARSMEIGIEINDFPLCEHLVVDQLTRDIASSASDNLLIEGLFLDALLSDIPNIIRIELTCEDSERLRRFVNREHTDNLKSRDQDDNDLRRRLHGTHSSTPHNKIDTTEKSADQVVKEIVGWLRTQNQNGQHD